MNIFPYIRNYLNPLGKAVNPNSKDDSDDESVSSVGSSESDSSFITDGTDAEKSSVISEAEDQSVSSSYSPSADSPAQNPTAAAPGRFVVRTGSKDHDFNHNRQELIKQRFEALGNTLKAASKDSANKLKLDPARFAIVFQPAKDAKDRSVRLVQKNAKTGQLETIATDADFKAVLGKVDAIREAYEALIEEIIESDTNETVEGKLKQTEKNSPKNTQVKEISVKVDPTAKEYTVEMDKALQPPIKITPEQEAERENLIRGHALYPFHEYLGKPKKEPEVTVGNIGDGNRARSASMTSDPSSKGEADNNSTESVASKERKETNGDIIRQKYKNRCKEQVGGINPLKKLGPLKDDESIDSVDPQFDNISELTEDFNDEEYHLDRLDDSTITSSTSLVASKGSRGRYSKSFAQRYQRYYGKPLIEENRKNEFGDLEEDNSRGSVDSRKNERWYEDDYNSMKSSLSSSSSKFLHDQVFPLVTSSDPLFSLRDEEETFSMKDDDNLSKASTVEAMKLFTRSVPFRVSEREGIEDLLFPKSVEIDHTVKQELEDDTAKIEQTVYGNKISPFSTTTTDSPQELSSDEDDDKVMKTLESRRFESQSEPWIFELERELQSAWSALETSIESYRKAIKGKDSAERIEKKKAYTSALNDFNEFWAGEDAITEQMNQLTNTSEWKARFDFLRQVETEFKKSNEQIQKVQDAVDLEILEMSKAAESEADLVTSWKRLYIEVAAYTKYVNQFRMKKVGKKVVQDACKRYQIALQNFETLWTAEVAMARVEDEKWKKRIKRIESKIQYLNTALDAELPSTTFEAKSMDDLPAPREVTLSSLSKRSGSAPSRFSRHTSSSSKGESLSLVEDTRDQLDLELKWNVLNVATDQFVKALETKGSQMPVKRAGEAFKKVREDFEKVVKELIETGFPIDPKFSVDLCLEKIRNAKIAEDESDDEVITPVSPVEKRSIKPIPDFIAAVRRLNTLTKQCVQAALEGSLSEKLEKEYSKAKELYASEQKKNKANTIAANRKRLEVLTKDVLDSCDKQIAEAKKEFERRGK